jgi:two-component system CheB/CheR fusion protein
MSQKFLPLYTETPPATGAARAPPADAALFPIVGIGASAGGLDACKKLLNALPAGIGMAFILVQHLDPTHESMMVELLANHTRMPVQQAGDEMRIEPDHVYVIPPGADLSVADGCLHLSRPHARHGARLPFDFLLHSLAEACGARAVCVVLSGTGADGSLGLKAIKQQGGLVIAQEPGEAGFDGMPGSAIATGVVDLVLTAAAIPDALVAHGRRASLPQMQAPEPDPARNLSSEIIDLLRMKTAHDFTLYKRGTLQRRIERRMAMAPAKTGSMADYLGVLRSDATELDRLANDLLINVTSFFRDPKVFDLLATTIVPDLVRNHPRDRPVRVWIAGCSTGEETYSLAMLFREEIMAAKLNIKLQVFASDVDPDAIASAREGRYPAAIEADVSQARLARFFTKDDQSYTVSPDLRSVVVFTVQDVLADPPFSRLDFISCRNLLIYLLPEAQDKVLSLFHFALREAGVLLLGTTETVGSVAGRFEVISKPERLYRRAGDSRAGALRFPVSAGEGALLQARSDRNAAPSRQAVLADLCQRLVLEAYAPAAVLINRKYECLYSLGPTDRYLRVAPGLPTHDLLAMTRDDMRIRLRSAIQQATQTNGPVAVAGGQTNRDGGAVPFDIAVQPASSGGEDLLLVSFIDGPRLESTAGRLSASQPPDLKQELEATRAELQGAIRNLEISNEEQKAINEEALSNQEEYQSTNEELLTSKEELQALNEELTALNGQLHETLERQRTTSNDLQNVLYSTDVATLFLDTDLKIRFFTPATKSLFAVIASDIGRPIADLHALAVDNAMLSDAQTVLETATPVGREIKAQNGAWYVRRILPYRTQEGDVEGVVITFSDITERQLVSDELEVAKRQAELATIAKSRFLAAASHDLRQPLQTLTLLQGLLAKTVEGERQQKLVRRMDDTLGAMSGMLNTLLDINQIEGGTVHAEKSDFPISGLLGRLSDEFAYHAQAKRISLHVVPCSLSINSDPRLLEQMLRNLLSNAIKYTSTGKVLIGCRRHGPMLSIEVRDTGIGIPHTEIQAIFEEYHQVDNAARERSRGLGLGLSIVQRLGQLLDHPVSVRSQPGVGSMFAVQVPRAANIGSSAGMQRDTLDTAALAGAPRTGAILVIEDDPEVRDLLELFLKDDGYRVTAAPDGVAALVLMTHGTIRPDLILADFNLPNGLNGLQVIAKIRERFHYQVPGIILTGDISTGTVRGIALQDCVQLVKPVKLTELAQAIQRMLPNWQSSPAPGVHQPTGQAGNLTTPVIYVVDDDAPIRDAVRSVLEDEGLVVEDFADCEAFLAAYRPGREACLVIDAYLPGMSGLDLLQQLHDAGHRLPAIMITGNSDVSIAVHAMKAGASDFIEKPISRAELVTSVERALEQSRDAGKLAAWQQDAAGHVSGLTQRQRQIMELVLAGHPSKNIAADLGISQRTVENHRASIMKRTGSKSLPALARLAVAAGGTGG